MTSLAFTTASFNAFADENINAFHECYHSDIHTCSPQQFPLKSSSFLLLICYLYFSLVFSSSLLYSSCYCSLPLSDALLHLLILHLLLPTFQVLPLLTGQKQARDTWHQPTPFAPPALKWRDFKSQRWRVCAFERNSNAQQLEELLPVKQFIHCWSPRL